MRKIQLFNKESSKQLGLAVSSNKIRFVISTCVRNRQALLEYGEFPRKDLINVLQEIKKSINNNVCCHLALPHRFMILKNLQFTDCFAQQEIEELLSLNSEKYFAHPFDKILFDYELVGNEKNQIRALASKREEVCSWIDLFNSVDLKLKTLTADVLALERILQYQDILEKDKVYGIFYLDGTELLQVIIQNTFICFLNTTSLAEISTFNLNEEIQKFLRLYEINNPIFHPLTDIIFFSDQSDIQFIKMDVYQINYLSKQTLLLQNKPIPVSYLLPLGVTLPC